MYQPLTVFCATWNTGNAPPPEDITPWLPKADFDIYAIGAQECGYDPRDGYETCEDDWNGTLQKHFGEEDYVLLVAFSITPQVVDKWPDSETARLKTLLKNMSLEAAAEKKIQAEKDEVVAPGEIRISIFVKKTLRPHISSITSAIQTTGRLGGLSGNKGGLSVSFKVGNTRLAFFNAHLNAHTENLERRNQDTFAIFRGLKGSIPNFEPTQAHYCFFFGDLNYRVTLEHKETLDIIEQRNWEGLLKHDQLLDQISRGAALANFKEPPINFAPTFKVKRNQPLVYNGDRVPSYCDRILYKVYPGMQITSDLYSSIENIKTSDHKPVHCLFNIRFLPVKELPDSPEVVRQIVVSDLKATDLQTQSLEKPRLQVVICLSWNQHMTFASTGLNSRPSWKDTLTLDTANIPLVIFRNSYLVLGVRNVDTDQTTLLGESHIPLHTVLERPANFTLHLHQFALPHGVLTGKISCVTSPHV